MPGSLVTGSLVTGSLVTGSSATGSLVTGSLVTGSLVTGSPCYRFPCYPVHCYPVHCYPVPLLPGTLLPGSLVTRFLGYPVPWLPGSLVTRLLKLLTVIEVYPGQEPQSYPTLPGCAQWPIGRSWPHHSVLIHVVSPSFVRRTTWFVLPCPVGAIQQLSVILYYCSPWCSTVRYSSPGCLKDEN